MYSKRTRIGVRDNDLRHKYGIDNEAYELMLVMQGGCCRICKSSKPGGKWNGNFMVDHDHETGRIRGLLCTACNHALGKFQDSPEVLLSAVEYLRVSSPHRFSIDSGSAELSDTLR